MAKKLLGKASDIPLGTMKQFVVEGHDEVLVANVGGEFKAMRAICNHAGGPLGEGTLEGTIVTCPWHGSKWDVNTGKMTEFAVELDDEPVYIVTVEGESIYIDI
jgi:nitrite reductase/ring-hydroxylating ferredoxin subunit